MTVFLEISARCRDWAGPWIQITEKTPNLPAHTRIRTIGAQLESAFDGVRDEWWGIARRITAETSGHLSIAGSCASFASDFGLMLSWLRVVADVAHTGPDTLVVCDDPWLFRALCSIEGVRAGAAPGLLVPRLKLVIRGLLSRVRVSLRITAAVIRLRGGRLKQQSGSPYILVYGHPGSSALDDVYFGDLLDRIADLRRIVHTDDDRVVRRLASDRRTESLHAYGSILYALACLVWVRWRYPDLGLAPSQDWILRRAVAREGGGGAAAMTQWQIHCQTRFLSSQRPSCIAWPWENHQWERAIVRAAGATGVATIGYQHTDAGPHQFNMSPNANSRGLDEIPDTIILNGPAYYDHFTSWGIPVDRLVIGGAFRMPAKAVQRYQADGPIFVALSSNAEISIEMLQAVRSARRPGRRFLVKAHPMYPFDIPEGDGIARTEIPFSQTTGISALLYGTGSSGIEGLLSGVPTFRLLPSRRTGIETMPDGLRARTVTGQGLDAALDGVAAVPSKNPKDFFSDVDISVWRTLFAAPHAGAHRAER